MRQSYRTPRGYVHPRIEVEEFLKWWKMGFNAPQVAKKMNIPQDRAYSIKNHVLPLIPRPY